MILSSAVVIGFGAGLIRARLSNRRFTAPRLRLMWLVWLAFMPQWLVFFQPGLIADLPDAWASLVLCVSQLLLLVFAWFNRRLLGLRLMALGLLLNLLVITVNGGWMPISPSTVQAIYPQAPADSWQVGQRLGSGKDIVLNPEDMRLGFLSDCFILPAWTGYPLAFSLGDVVLAVGVGWLLWSLGNTPYRRDHDQPKSIPGYPGLQVRAVSGIQPVVVRGGYQPALPAAAVVEPG
jgi:hypothetical protein